MQLRIPALVTFSAVLLQVSLAGTLGTLSKQDNETTRIIGGQSATEGQFPYAAVLFFNDHFICTSSIISPRTILTAAHCVVFNGVLQQVSRFHAIANYRMSASEVRIDFESITPHPEYTNIDGIRNDIAILTTTEPITFTSTVQPICIAHSDTPSKECKNATAMGWGYTIRESAKVPDELQYVELKIVPNRICSIAYLFTPVEDSKICAGSLNGICSGDSGGPLVYLSADKPPVEIGVASYITGIFGCGSLIPGVWSRVSSFNDFILQNSLDGDSICRI